MFDLYKAEKGVPNITVELACNAFSYQASKTIVYTPLHPLQVKNSNYEKASDSFSLMIANILMTTRKRKPLKAGV
jgi:hypothetical protein